MSETSELVPELKAGKDLSLLELFELLQPKLKNEAIQPIFMLCVSEEYTAATIEGQKADMVVLLSEILMEQKELLNLLDDSLALAKVGKISHLLEPALEERNGN